jgi:glutathione S-transferase
MEQLLNKGYEALNVMEQQLVKTTFMVREEMTQADIALFAYTHVAKEGEFDLSRSWCQSLFWVCWNGHFARVMYIKYRHLISSCC